MDVKRIGDSIQLQRARTAVAARTRCSRAARFVDGTLNFRVRTRLWNGHGRKYISRTWWKAMAAEPTEKETTNRARSNRG